MNLRVIGCNYRTAPVELREKLAFSDAARDAAALELTARYGCEAAILSTCNRVELAIARAPEESPFDLDLAAEFLAERHQQPVAEIRKLLYSHDGNAAVRHLFRVAASLDSLVLGEGQIAGQVKKAFESAQTLGTAGPMLQAIFPQALRVAKRVRTETGISLGHASVSSVAVDYVKQVFEHFHDKTVCVVGAGKMARLTLNHLKALKPKQILVVNRSPEKAEEVAKDCGGAVVPWDELDAALAASEIVLSTTGAPEPIVSKERFRKQIQPKRSGPMVILDIAVPRDFDPAIHDGDRVCVFNIDDLVKVREATLQERRKCIAPAESIVEAEVTRFTEDWNRRRSGPVIQQLRGEVDKLRDAVLNPLLEKLNGKLSDEERAYVAGAFRLFQNRLLHGPIAALQEASREGQSQTLLESLKKLFRLGE